MADYLTYAKETMNFINSRKKQGPEGIYWSLQDAAEGRSIYYDEICMYAGASGIIVFLLGLYQTTNDVSYLQEAEEAATYIRYRFDHDRDLKRNFSKYAFSSGWSGAGFAMIQLYKITGNEKYKTFVADIIESAKADAKPGKNGRGYSWTSFPGIVGDAGTVLFFLYAAKTFGREDWTAFAAKAGENFLGQRHDAGNGTCWYPGVDPVYFGAKEDYIDPNFPMGTGGIGFVLLNLYEASGDQKFLDATKGIADFMIAQAVKMKAGSLIPHGLPDRKDLFYLGYCHGPAGTNRFFYKLYEMTGEDRYKRYIDMLTQGVIDTGAPEVRTEGYWNTYNICCGTAGLLNMYLGLWAAFGDETYLEQAKRCGKVITDGATITDGTEGRECAWRFALDRVAPDVLSTPIGLFDGAAGIGAVLLQLVSAEKGQFHATRMLDDPFPEKNKL
jgi:hypothetical protein